MNLNLNLILYKFKLKLLRQKEKTNGIIISKNKICILFHLFYDSRESS